MQNPYKSISIGLLHLFINSSFGIAWTKDAHSMDSTGKAGRSIGKVAAVVARRVAVVAGQVVEAVVKVVAVVMGIDRDVMVEVESTAQQNTAQHKTAENNTPLSQHTISHHNIPMLDVSSAKKKAVLSRENCSVYGNGGLDNSLVALHFWRMPMVVVEVMA